jgi:RHS repeat-associated protein
VIEERQNGTATSNVSYQYVWGLGGTDELVLRDTYSSGTRTARYYAQWDASGNVTSLISTAGTVVERYLYDPYGSVTYTDASYNTRSSSSYTWRHLNETARLDTITGWFGMRFRDYIPAEGRWAERDPLSYAAGDMNVYAFVGDGPTYAVDPSGLATMMYGPNGPVHRFRASCSDEYHPHGNWDWLDHTSNFFAGYGDQKTGGLTRHIRRAFGWNDGIDQQSATYQAGGVVADVQDMLAPGNPCDLARKAVVTGSQGLRIAGQVQRGFQYAQVAGRTLNGVEALQNGDPLGAALEFNGAIRGARQANRPCFAAGTPIRTPEGSKPIEELEPGDLFLAMPEDDEDGSIEPRVVEAVFANYSPLLGICVGRELILTTPEHPFFVLGRGWTNAQELMTGDQLRCEDGWIVLSEIERDLPPAPVYNMGIAQDHTYFVGGAKWGFSVWSHNTGSNCGAQAGTQSGGRYRGGPHSETSRPRRDGLDSHHMPPKSVSGIEDPLERGPAIQMDPADHRATGSHSNNPGSFRYRAEIQDMIDDNNMRGAMAREMRDVRRAAGDVSGDRRKYNGAMQEMLDYAKKEGIVPPRP